MKKIDVIIGTQVISKGHNFPNIKTVGILNIDSLLNDFDFRSNEKAFQQIMQVSGRAGRKCYWQCYYSNISARTSNNKNV